MFYDVLTDFIFVEDAPEKADVIFVPGGSYPESAVNAASLWKRGYAPWICPSGKYSKTVGHFLEPAKRGTAPIVTSAAEATAGANTAATGTPAAACTADDGQHPAADWTGAVRWQTEWEYLRDVLVSEGVPESAILKEDKATFTWENAIYSRQVLEKLEIPVRRAILSVQAFHARRCLMYYQLEFPDTEFLVCPIVTRGISRENWFAFPEGIDTVLGEVERCGGQFHEIMKSKIERQRSNRW